MNNIKVGDIISVRHYSGLSAFKSVVVEKDAETLSVKLTKEVSILNFLEGDPVVFGYVLNDQVYIYGCNVLKVNAKNDILVLQVDKIDLSAERRLSERYPVSLYADIRLEDSRKKHLATIKDMSHTGMLIYTKLEMQITERLQLDIYMDKTMVFLKANIARKLQRPEFNEYGLAIIYEDRNAIETMKEYIKRLQKEQEDAIRRLKLK